MKTKLRSLIAIALAIVMVVGLMPMAAAAEPAEPKIEWKLPDKSGSEEPIRLLCLGDSTSNGYFLDGYIDDLQGIGSNAGNTCYPVKVYNDLVNIYGKDRVIFSQFCINSMRWNELRIVLEKSLGKTENLCFSDAFSNDRVRSYPGSFGGAVTSGLSYIGDPSVYAGKTGEDAWYSTFKDSVENADVITIDLGMNNFGTYLSSRLMENMTNGKPAIGADYSENLEDIRAELDSLFPQAALALRQVEGGLLQTISTDYNGWAQLVGQSVGQSFETVTDMLQFFDTYLDAQTAKGYLDSAASALYEQNPQGWMFFDIAETIVYSYACVLLNYDKSMGYIYEANPDAMVIVNGMYNSMAGMVAEMGGNTMQFGELWGTLIDMVNGYLSGALTTFGTNRYADKIRFNPIEKNLPIFVDKIKNFSDDPMTDYHKDGFDKTTLECIIDMVYLLNANIGGSDLTPTISGALMSGIHDATYANVLSSLASNSTLNNSLVKMLVGNVDTAAIASYVADKVIEGVKTNCCADKNTLTRSDIKRAYANNTISSFALDTSSLGLSQFIQIARGDYSSLDSLCLDSKNSNFAVAAGFEIIRKNMVKAAALETISLETVFSVFGGGADMVSLVAPALSDFDNASPAGQMLLHLCVRFFSLRGVGTHPSEEGAAMKYAAVKSKMPQMKLIVHYQYENGTQAAEDYMVSPSEGDDFTVTSPTIDGYEPDTAVVSGTMGDTQQVYTVKYSPKKYTLTIHYQYYNGTAIADVEDYVDNTLVSGSTYNVKSPTVANFIPDKEYVSGTIGTEDVNVTVTYDTVKYPLTIHYQYSDGTPARDDYVESFGVGNAYSIEINPITGYNVDISKVEGFMPAKPVEVTVTYTPIKVKLTIHYQYENGTPAAEDYTEEVAYNSTYSVTTPTKTGYTPSDAVISGTMTSTEPVEKTVIYYLGSYNLLIHYQYENGDKAAEDHSAKVTVGDQYSITSPSIDHYNADKAVIQGTMGYDLVEETVTYSPKKYTLTINYEFDDETEAAETYTEEVAFNSTYSVVSPTVEGYAPDQTVVSGKMPGEATTITVVYTENAWGYCKTEPQEVSLSSGTHHLYINGVDMGEYTFAGSGSSWTIKDSTGYLAVSGSSLTHSQNAFTWTYSNNRFSYQAARNTSSFFSFFSRTTTYYLGTSNNNLALTTSTSRTTATFYDMGASEQQMHVPQVVIENRVPATCKDYETYDQVTYCSLCHEELKRDHIVGTVLSDVHTPGNVETKNVVAPTCEDDGSHDEVICCTVCGKELSNKTVTDKATGHTPGDAHVEEIEGIKYLIVRCKNCDYIFSQEDAPAGEITAEVTVTSSSSSRYLLFFTRTTYTVTINAKSTFTGINITKVEHSTNNRTWSTGSSYSTTTNPSTIYIRVTASDGSVTNFTYRNGITTKNT